MATVTTTEVNTGIPTTWDQGGPASAFGKIVYEGTFVIPSKLAADENSIVWTLTLPPNNFYRFMGFEAMLIAPSQGDISDIEYGMRGLITEDQVTVRNFPVLSVINPGNQSNGSESFKYNPDTTTNDFAAFFRNAWDVSDELINAGGRNASIIQINWMDTSADVTAAMSCQYRALAFMYTVAQSRTFAPNSPSLVTL